MSLRNARTSSMMRCGGLAHDELELAVAAARSTTLTKASTERRSAGRKWREAGLRGTAAVLVTGLEHVGLLYDLACITQKLGAVVGECNTAVKRKDFDMKFLFQAFDGV